MNIKIDDQISIGVAFDPSDREEGYQDEIRFKISEIGPEDTRLFAADETSVLLTIKQAEALAAALQTAANEARNTPRT